MQLEYVIYRRVLRYYSGEEDGLGEIIDTQPLIKVFCFILYIYNLFVFCSIFRYEKSVISGCGEEVYHTSQEARYSR